MKIKKSKKPAVKSAKVGTEVLLNEITLLRKALDDQYGLLTLLAAERGELETLLCMLYGGVSNELEDMPVRLQHVKNAFRFKEESGTYPQCWANPHLKPIAQQNWNEMHAQIAKHLGTELAIVRTVRCPECNITFRFTSGYEMTVMPCPRCHKVNPLARFLAVT